jgi:methyltransferase
MATWFLLFFILLLLQRVSELSIASKHAKWMYSNGGIEFGAKHYKYIVMIHSGFLLSLLIEVIWLGATPPPWWAIALLVFGFAQVLRYWCIHSLGVYWNTRIFILPNSKMIASGPYRWLKHPNYLTVNIEFLVIPLVFGAYFTAVIWFLINYAFLKFVRIPAEENALRVLRKP